MATHFHKLTIKDIRSETAECISLAFDIPVELKEQFMFTQGQNITVRADVDGEEIRRSYSICSSPIEDELRIAIKKIPFGKFSSHAETIKKNGYLEVLPPTGMFYTALQPSNQKYYLSFAAGSGITPVFSIIKTVLATEKQSSFTLVYGNKNRGSIIFKEELEALKNRYMNRFVLHHILSREETELAVNHGRITKDKCNELAPLLTELSTLDDCFLCGPEQMIFSVKEWLVARGVEKNKIHFELFTVPGERTVGRSSTPEIGHTQSSTQVSRVTVKSDGIAFDFDLPYGAEAILDAAIKQGADLPYACKGGVCSTCRAKLIEGKVDMEHNYALEPDELAKGYILTCQSHPVSEKVIVDFDIK